MKISQVDVYQVDLPYSGGTYRLSGGREYAIFDATIVRLTSDTGLTGFGESTPFGATYVAAHALGVRAGIAEIAPAILGLDPRRVDRVYDAMDGALVGHGHAKAALDIACWDLFGKAVGMPVCDLLGGRTLQPMGVISSIYAGTPETMRERVQAHRLQGYRGHSIKNGGLTPCRRQRDMCISAGYSLSVQDTVGSDIAFAAIAHLGQTIPAHLLRCILDTRDMVTITTADATDKGAFKRHDGWVTAPETPGLGIEPRMEVLGEPVMTYCL